MALSITLIALAVERRRPWATMATEVEQTSRPELLRDAQLVYMETLFRIRSPIELVARLDRGYLTRQGQIVLVELKKRWSHRPFLTDVIQLSAQRLAVMGQTGRPVSRFGCVVVRSPDKWPKQTFHWVELLPAEEVTALADHLTFRSRG